MLPRILAHGRSPMLAGLVVIGLASAAAGIGIAYAVAGLFSTALGEPSSLSMHVLFALLPAAALMLLLMQVAQRTLAEHLGQHYVVELRSEIFDRLHALADGERARLRQGHLMTRFTADLTAIQAWVAQGLAAALTGGATLFGLLLFLASINVVFGLLVMAGATVVIVAVFLLGPALRERIRWARRRRARVSAFMGERITAMSGVRALRAGSADRRRLLKLSRRLAKAMVRRAAWIESVRALPGTGGLLLPALCLAMAPWVAADVLAPQTLVLVMTVAGLSAQPLTQLSQAYVHRSNFVVARNMLAFLFSLRLQPTRGGKGRGLPPGPAAIKICRLVPAEGAAPLKVHAEAGARIVVKGDAGIGKTRLLRMLAGFERVPARTVTLKGRDLARIWLESLHREIRLLSPDLPLLKGTLRRNVGLSGTDTQALSDLLERCGVTPELLGTHEPDDFHVREAGVNVGSSLHMRILLARALAGQPRVLLVDDFDRVRDPLVSRRIRDLWDGDDDITIVMVTQSDEIEASADHVWHIEPTHSVNETPEVSRQEKESTHEAA